MMQRDSWYELAMHTATAPHQKVALEAAHRQEAHEHFLAHQCAAVREANRRGSAADHMASAGVKL